MEGDGEVNLAQLCRMERELSATTDIDELLARIAGFSRELTEAEGSSILLLDEERQELYFKEALGKMGEIVRRIRVPLSEGSIAGAALLQRRPQLVNDVAADPRHFKSVDQATGLSTRTLLAVPILAGSRAYGVIEVINKRQGGFDARDEQALSILADHAAVVLHNVRLLEELQDFFKHTQEMLVTALENLEPRSRGHVTRVTRLACRLGRELGLAGAEYETLFFAAHFHDVGKLLVPAWEAGDVEHAVAGASYLAGVRLLARAAPLVRGHHERWDGSGGPDGLEGESLPLAGRVLALAEDFDEHLMDRPEGQPLEVHLGDFWSRRQGKHEPRLLSLLRRLVGEGLAPGQPVV
jgi:HD-GYP domain-containing protein (c-di-GMP phosphodiesterase class II)